MHYRLCRLVAGLGLGLLASAFALPGLGQIDEPDVGPDRAAVVELLRQATEREGAVEGDVSPALVTAYRNALQAIDAAEASERQADQWEKAASNAQATLAALQAEQAKLEDAAPLVLEGLGLTELEGLKVEKGIALEEAKKDFELLENATSDATDRSARIAQEQAELATARAKLEARLAGGEVAAGAPILASAQKMEFEAKLVRSAAKAAELRVEEATLEPRAEVRSQRLRLARMRVSAREGELNAIESALNSAREQEAQNERRAAIEAAEAAAMEGEEFVALAAQIVAERDETLRLTQELEVDRAKIEDLGEQVKDLTVRLERTKRRIEIAGLSKDTGLHLRRERQRLLDQRMTRAEALADRDRRTKIELALFEGESLINEAALDGVLMPSLVAAAAKDGRTGEEVVALARRLRDEYVEALKDKLDVLKVRSQQLLDITSLRTQTFERQRTYEAFVAERILWIRSSEPLWRVSPGQLAEELDQLPSQLSPGLTLRDVLADLGRRPVDVALIVLGLLILFVARFRVRKALAEEGDLARQRSQTSIAPTLRATIHSFLIAAPYAAVFYAISWLASTSSFDSELTRGLGKACQQATAAALIIGALRALTTKNGLEEAHFEADAEAVRLVRRHTNWLLPLMPTAALIGEFLVSLDAGAAANGLARIAFLVEVGSLLLFTWKVLSPRRGVLALNVRGSGAKDLVTRLRRLWFLLAVATLTLLAVLTVVGYGFTARALFGRFELTIGLVLLLVTTRSIALRWIKLIRRREALERLRKKREELREKRLAEIERRRNAGEDLGELESEGLEVEQEGVSLSAISTDLKRLIRVVTVVTAIGGAYWIWSSVLPALGAFERVRLWTRQVAVTDPDGVLTSTIESVTLASVGLAILILLATWRAVSDLPALIEVVLLQRMSLGSGERYAVTTLMRYLLTTIGVLLAFDELGLAWSQLQWLVAGISVGLGFGLQEIFANFVSGITLLFERPVRVGDWVTLGDIEGVVSKIRIRATTIRDRDLKELIVPNREFITGRFINWTLSDPVSRVTAAVGIAYGSDTERAIQLLLEAGRECPYSVPEPAPNVVFSSFGSSSLDFELRVFVTGREIKPRVLHDLHMRIDAAFRAANIEISFPQRDLHIRSSSGLDGFRRQSEEG